MLISMKPTLVQHLVFLHIHVYSHKLFGLDTQTETYDLIFFCINLSYVDFTTGMGTSSILAGVIMAVLWRASGSQFDISSLLHAVSYENIDLT